MTPVQFVSALATVEFAHTFNPYRHRCELHDRQQAPYIRCNALTEMLLKAQGSGIAAIWIGRDLGYRGGRRTGLALTDDVHIEAHGRRWGLDFERPTIGPPIAERTAAVIWRVLSAVEAPIFLWNVFPFHPHEAESEFTNRSHNAVERRAGEELLALLVEMLRPRQLIAIGNDAANSARKIASDQQVVQVRHPSYGGQGEFLAAMSALYQLPNCTRQMSLL